MQLLVSVRLASEADSALAGGADIIDAKEPSRGALGSVSPPTLAAIMSRVPADRPFSAALGDVSTLEAMVQTLGSLELPPRHGPTYLKVGFAGVRSPKLLRAVLTEAVRRTALHASSASLIAVAYADAERAESVSPEIIAQLAQETGARGILIDTHVKDGKRLVDWWSPDRLTGWVAKAQAEGLLVGVAGALGTGDIAAVASANPDVIGFRGAACMSGRLGTISADRVAELRRELDAVRSPSLFVLPTAP
jgi:uncharacterized protein (UPF0264 family)